MKSSLSIGVMFLFALFVPFAEAAVMDVPTMPQVFEYFPDSAAVVDSNPSVAQPIGIGSAADGGENLSLNVSLPQFSGPVDVYFGIYAPSLSSDIYLLHPDMTLQPLSAGLVPWKSGTTGPVQQPLFGDIPWSALPYAEYMFFTMVTPPQNLSPTALRGVLTETFNGNSRAAGTRTAVSVFPTIYNLWIADIDVCPSVFQQTTSATLAMSLAVSGIWGSLTANQSTKFTIYWNNHVYGTSSGNPWVETADLGYCQITGTSNVTVRGRICEDQDRALTVRLYSKETYYPLTYTCFGVSLPLNEYPWTDEMFVQFTPSVSYVDHEPYSYKSSSFEKTYTLEDWPIAY